MNNKSIWITVIAVLIVLGGIFWYLVKTAPALDEVMITDDTPTSADNAPEGSIHNLPVPQGVGAVRKAVARRLGVGEGSVIILEAQERTWPDSCLGFLSKEVLCAQVITPGYRVTLQAKGETFIYRTNADGSTMQEESRGE